MSIVIKVVFPYSSFIEIYYQFQVTIDRFHIDNIGKEGRFEWILPGTVT